MLVIRIAEFTTLSTHVARDVGGQVLVVRR